VNPIHPQLAALALAAKEMTRARTGETPAKLAAALRDAVRGQHGWLRPEHRIGDPANYMRHLLYVDPDGDFVMSVLVWLPGQQSPVHGHEVWCAYGVVEGELTEEQYRAAGNRIEPAKTAVLRAGDIADLDVDRRVIHRVCNRSDAPLATLHLYGVAAERLTTGINRLYPLGLDQPS
jgi:predicted metal-dependent enzyme (double-stranded beta helix superfamily)